MSAENPQYPPPAQPYPQQPQESQQGAAAPAPYPGAAPDYPGYTPGGYPNYPGYPGYPAQPGYPAYGAAPYYAGPMPRKTNGMAIASLALSIASWIVIPLIGAILGVIFGHIALGQLRRADGAEEGRGLAIAGLAVGYVNLVLWFLVGLVVVIIVLAATAASGGGTSLLASLW